MGHPQGLAGGVESLRAAWDAVLAGVPLIQAARENAALAASLKAFA